MLSGALFRGGEGGAAGPRDDDAFGADALNSERPWFPSDELFDFGLKEGDRKT